MNAPLIMTQALDSAPAGDAIEIERLEKRFGGRRVLENLSLSIAPGEFVAVIGRSGCGKTTLLRLLAGLDRATSGVIRIGGRGVEGLQANTRLLFQDARLLPWQTVVQNVGIARGAGWAPRAAAALADVGLADRGGDWPAKLSGGQRQRVALARALIGAPHVLLLDEPFGALDALTRREMHELLLRIWQARRFTTLLITHDVNEALTLADRVVVLKHGGVTFEAAVPLPRSAWREGDPLLADLHGRILDAV